MAGKKSTEQQASSDEQEKKLGPGVTYTPEDENDKTPAKFMDVTFIPGESVNLIERLGEARGQAAIDKLAQNRFFKVDGGTDWKQELETRAQAEEKEREREQQAKEEAERQQQQASEKSTPVNNENGQVGTLPPPPDNWQGPDEMRLESDSAANRPQVSTGDSTPTPSTEPTSTPSTEPADKPAKAR